MAKPKVNKPLSTPTLHSFFGKKIVAETPSTVASTLPLDEEEKKDDIDETVEVANHVNEEQGADDEMEQMEEVNEGQQNKSNRVHRQKYPIGTEVKKDFGEHGFFVGKLVSFSSDYYHIVYEDGDDEDISLGEMSTVVAQFQADTKKKKVVKKSLRRKKIGNTSVEVGKTLLRCRHGR